VLNANLSPTIHGLMAWTLLLSFIAFTVLFAWMVLMRLRLEELEDTDTDVALDAALALRREEA
jgi:hypothetical protein